MGSDASCYGEADGSIELTVIGGTAPYSYNWDNARMLRRPEQAERRQLHGDGNGRERLRNDIQAVVIEEPSDIAIDIDDITNADCSGNADGSATVTASGGTAPA